MSKFWPLLRKKWKLKMKCWSKWNYKISSFMEAFQENMHIFTNILPQSIQIMTASFNPNPFQYWQVNHYQELCHPQTGSSIYSFADVGKVNHYPDPYYQHNQSVNSESSLGNNSQIITEDGEKQYTDLS